MALEDRDFGAVFDVPDARRRVEGRRDDTVPIRTERSMRDPTVMAEDHGLPVLGERFVERRLRFEQIRPVGRRHVGRQPFQRQ